MRMIFRLAALGVALVTLVLWFFGGPNLGWTKTHVTRMEIEAVTEIAHPVVEKRFLPGVDFLAAGLLGAAVVAGSSFIFRKK